MLHFQPSKIKLVLVAQTYQAFIIRRHRDNIWIIVMLNPWPWAEKNLQDILELH